MRFFKFILFIFIGIYSCSVSLASAESNVKGFYNNFDGVKAVDQNNHQFDITQLQSKIALFNFIYTQCSSICHTQTQALSKVYHQLPEAIKNSIAFVSISLDPLKDGPLVLKNYAEKFKANAPNWYFLSLNFFDIKTLSTNLILFKPDYGKTLYDALENSLEGRVSVSYNLAEHASHLWLIDTSGQVRQKYLGNPVDVNRLTQELVALHRIEFSKDI